MIYLASPYSHQSFAEVENRFALTEQCTYELMKRGLPVFSPIVHCHQIATDYNLPTDAKFWEKYNMQFLRKADAIYVLKIDGWDESKGVAQEMGVAKALYLPLHFVNEYGIEVL